MAAEKPEIKGAGDRPWLDLALERLDLGIVEETHGPASWRIEVNTEEPAHG